MTPKTKCKALLGMLPSNIKKNTRRPYAKICWFCSNFSFMLKKWRFLSKGCDDERHIGKGLVFIEPKNTNTPALFAFAVNALDIYVRILGFDWERKL